MFEESLTKDPVLGTVAASLLSLKSASTELQNGHFNVQRNGLELKFASKQLKDNEQLVSTAVRQNGMALQFASDRLRGDEKIVSAAVGQNGMALRFASDDLKKRREIVMVAITQNGLALRFVDNYLRYKLEIISAAVKQNGMALIHALGTLDIRMIVKAVINNPRVLQQEKISQYAINHWIIDQAVRKNGFVLQYAGDILKNNKDIVMAAVTQNGMALGYASDLLKEDKDIVMAAVNQNASALTFVNDNLKDTLTKNNSHLRKRKRNEGPDPEETPVTKTTKIIGP